MGIKINFADVPNFDPVPEGIYTVRVVKVEGKANKAGDGTYLNWELEITDGEFAERKLWMITSLKPNMYWAVKRAFVGFGFEDDAEIELEFDEETNYLTSPEVVDCVGEAVVTQTVYQGKIRNQVEEIRPSGSDTTPEVEVKAKPAAAKGVAAKKFR